VKRGPGNSRTLRLLLDEQLSPTVAHRLAALGFDVTCARDRGLLGWNDWSLFKWCIERDYVLSTKNGDDFEAEHERAMQRGEHHAGVLIVGDWSTEEIFIAAREFLEQAHSSLRDSVCYLRKGSS
jgi:predicted nuclease of predicted toxin-antitoxin system